jgi:hypothetical protein
VILTAVDFCLPCRKDPRLVVRVQSSAPGQDVYEFFTMLAICNTVLPRPLENGDIRYEAEV